ncbi:hypothetical protein ACIGKM_11600 [Ectopseudomonas toyotomiensis]|uniref:hypothetical protein n=1 Tax=Ectopseudomonas toyotomiensis TaxID=554344 RepID=UPI0037CB2E23
MLKIYKNLRWLKLQQALEYIELLAGVEMTAEVLYQFGRERQIPIYVDIGLPGVKGKRTDTKEETEVVGIQQVLNPDMAFADEEQTCAVLKHEDAHWLGLLPRPRRTVMLKREDVEALASQFNGAITAEQGAPRAASGNPSEETVADSTISCNGLTFPYATRELEAMHAAALKYWANHTPDKRQPTQKEVGYELCDLLGLARKDGGDLPRKAVVLAAAIRPDTLPDA